MDPSPTTPPTNNNCNTPDTENETPPAPPPPTSSSPPHKPLLQFTNGALKGQSQKQLHHLFNLPLPPISSPAASIAYKECLKNHAAAMGGHAVDGCGEFMPSPNFNPTDPTSFKCAACGCHRNFHRREDEYPPTSNLSLEFHRYPALLPPPPPRRSSPFSSPSPPPPPPIPSHFGSAPNMLLALSTAVAEEHPGLTPITPTGAKSENPSGRKRFRTRFSHEQKEKMYSFSEKLGWKMQKSDEGRVEEFCNEIGVRRGVLKVWMHNNKNTFGRKETMNNNSSVNGGRVPIFVDNGLNSSNHYNNSLKSNSNINGHQEEHNNGVHHPHVSSSGSPSSA